MAYSESLVTPDLAKTNVIVTSLADEDQWGLIFVYIIEEVAHAHVQNAPFELLMSRTGLGVVPRLLSEICWLRIWWSIFCDYMKGNCWSGLINTHSLLFM